MKKHVHWIILLISIVFYPQSSQAASYEIDAAHSSVSFKVRHLLSWTHGVFNEFSGFFEYVAGRPEEWSAEAVIEIASLDTGVKVRDEHLLGPDFFEAEKYPRMIFKSHTVADYDGMKAILKGELTLHGVTQPVDLELEILGEVKDPWGKHRAAFSAATTINRKDFGMEWNKVLEAGQLLVGEEVRIMIEVEGIRQD